VSKERALSLRHLTRRLTWALSAALALALPLALPPSAGLAATRILGTAEVIAHIEQALTRERPADYEIRLHGRQNPLRVPETAGVTVEDLYFEPSTGRFAATLLAADAQGAVRIPVAGTAAEMKQIPVPSRMVTAGEVIGEDDIEWMAVRAARLDRNIIAGADALIGKSPRRVLNPGQPVRASDVQRPEVVSKGAMVTMIVTQPGMVLTATGRALRGGGLGETIPILNTQSHRTVEGIVTGSDRVEIARQAGAIIGGTK
jgi:flagella basal body P-ring formation protein FlgA